MFAFIMLTFIQSFNENGFKTKKISLKSEFLYVKGVFSKRQNFDLWKICLFNLVVYIKKVYSKLVHKRVTKLGVMKLKSQNLRDRAERHDFW